MVKKTSKLTALTAIVLLLIIFMQTLSVSADAKRSYDTSVSAEEAAANTPKVDNTQKVHDLGNLYTSSEIEKLERMTNNLANEYGIDVVIVTTTDALGKNHLDYNADFYDYNNFGFGKKKDGIIFLIDMDNRQIDLTTTGKAIRIFTDNNIDYILDAAMRPMRSSENYYETSLVFLAYSENVLKAWPAYRNKIVLGSFAGGLAVSAIILFIMWNSMHRSSRAKAIPAQHYIPSGAAKITQTSDRFVNTFTSRTAIPQNTSSGGGSGGGGGPSFSGGSSSSSSSSGSSHGGGSRSF